MKVKKVSTQYNALIDNYEPDPTKRFDLSVQII